MKAREYYNQYIKSPSKDTVDSIFRSFNSDVLELIRKRSARSDGAIAAIIKEQNAKWNAMIRLFEEHGTPCPFKKDGLQSYYEYYIPELKSYNAQTKRMGVS